VRKRLVDPAIVDGKPITFRVKKSLVNTAFATVGLDDAHINSAPSYVHARTRVTGGQFEDLNEQLDVVAAMTQKQYDALHYVDYTGEGWVTVTIPEIASAVKRLPAYALVCAPDFFPSSGQYEVSEWSRSPEVPAQFRDRLWGVPPTPLSEMRLPANLQLPKSPFRADDVTITAVVAMGPPSGLPPLWPRQLDPQRSSSLPDDAAGVFAPGWDVGVDELPAASQSHLAAYRLGSPFPEDAKLCAALSTFWPAVAPDVYRTFATPMGNTSGTIAPLTDDEIGQTGSLAWDGIQPPRVVADGGNEFIEVAAFLNADYVRQALDNRFSPRLTSRISVEEYQARILAISRVYSVIGQLGPIDTTRGQRFVLSFRPVASGDPELQEAQAQAGAVLAGPAYRVEVCRNTSDELVAITPHTHRMPLRDRRSFFVSAPSTLVLSRREHDTHWAAKPSE
jgi:hypothetical protein